MEQKICPYYKIWTFDERNDISICEFDDCETSCDGKNCDRYYKFIECRKLFHQYHY